MQPAPPPFLTDDIRPLWHQLLAACSQPRTPVRWRISLLLHLLMTCRAGGSPARLMPWRGVIRQLRDPSARGPLKVVLERGYPTDLTTLCLWLAGHIERGGLRRYIVRYARHPNRQVRKKAVQALRRKQDWAMLRMVAASDPDPRIRTMASGAGQRPFARRLEWFLRGNTPKTPTHRPEKMVFTKTYQPGVGQRAKPLELIRELLERIRRLVSGKA